MPVGIADRAAGIVINVLTQRLLLLEANLKDVTTRLEKAVEFTKQQQAPQQQQPTDRSVADNNKLRPMVNEQILEEYLFAKIKSDDAGRSKLKVFVDTYNRILQAGYPFSKATLNEELIRSRSFSQEEAVEWIEWMEIK